MRPILLAFVLVACTEPGIPDHAGVIAPRVVALTSDPARPDGAVPRVSRLTLQTEPPLDGVDSVALVAGGADADEVTAIAKNRLTSALKARLVSSTHWLAGALYVQPLQLLAPGRTTLVVVPTRRPPLSVELTITGDEPELARRVWTSDQAITFCASSLPELPTSVALARPEGVAALRRLGAVPCFDVSAPAEGQLLPPEIAGLALDPSPLSIERVAPAGAPCPIGSIALDPLCLRLEDDRVILHGDPDARRLLLGTVGGRPLVERVEPGARLSLRGLLPESNVVLDLLARDALGDHRVHRVLTTRAAKRHVVINEVLIRPPSGATSQRFVELVNDGDRAVDLAGLELLDGTRSLVLPAGTLEPDGFALILPEGFVDGLGGEVAPPRGPARIFVDKLALSSGLSLVDVDGTVLSRFPPTTSTRTVARGRRTPDHPDDAPDAFGWDASGRATPGRKNLLAQP